MLYSHPFAGMGTNLRRSPEINALPGALFTIASTLKLPPPLLHHQRPRCHGTPHMSLRFTERIVDHLSHAKYLPSLPKAIAKDMRIDTDDLEEFQAAIEALAEEGRIQIGDDELVRLPRFGDEIVGVFRLNKKGFGFIIPDIATRDGDLFVPKGSSRDAISGDRVRAKVVRRAKRAFGRAPTPKSDVTGEIIEVIERGHDLFVGTLTKRGKQWLVEPDGRSLFDPVIVRDPGAKNAKEGDKVVIELLHYPQDNYIPEGVITKVLGEAGRPDVETEAVITAHGLRTEFPEAAIDEARNASRTFDKHAEGPWPDREDLTDQFIFTIDPPTAKDFDDAISITFDERAKTWELGVHIADVTTFVAPRSALDEEARERGNSSYLPRVTIPMLPEVLSNGVCSLQEGVARFTKSAFITLDDKGKVLDQRLANTVIRSRKRLTYIEAQALIDGDQDKARKNAITDPAYTPELLEKLRLADKLAKLIEARRHRDGMIVLNLPEVELVFDDKGHVIDAVPEDDSYTHKLIEMFMVEANEAVARVFVDLGVPILRRIHPEPVHGDIEEMRMYARAANQHVPEEPTRHDLQRILEATRHTPAARAIHFAVLRTLTKATYSPALIGHYALASEHYAHFTSPIRRYPDLAVHRACDAYLDLTENGRKKPGGRNRRSIGKKVASDARVPDEAALVQLGRHCSETEVESETAERELRSFLVMQFLAEHHLGAEFPAVITGVSNSGIYVSIERYLVEGKVQLQDLPQPSGRADQWRVDERTGRLVGQRSGASLRIGDIVTVKIARIILAARHMDLILTKFPERAPEDRESPPGGSRNRHQSRKDLKRAARSQKKIDDKKRAKSSGYKKGRRSSGR